MVIALAEVSDIIKETVQSVIGDRTYDHNTVDKWTGAITERILIQLAQLARPFKYALRCSIVQKTGAGYHSACACYWDNSTDGYCTVRWENDTVHAVMSAFAVAI